MTDRSQHHAPAGGGVAGLLLVWLVAYFTVRFWLEANPGLAESTRLALALVPVPLFSIFVWSFVRSVRRADELERRIQLEALAIAFPLGLLLLTTLGLVQRAVELDFQNWSYNHVWPMLVFFYFVGIVIARKRYG
jgi:hypothetical protein